MKIFFTIFQLILILVILINPVVFLFFREFLDNLESFERIAFVLLVSILEFIIILSLIKKLYHNPLLKLEYIIKSFIIGNLKNNEIKFQKTLNPHLNYTLLFFSKTLNTLKNIKQEFLHGKSIKSEVDIAKDIQGKTLDKKLEKIPSLNVIVKSKPAGEIGGDSYDIIKSEDNYYIYVGDATGHGVGAGFIMIMVNALVSGFSKVYKSGAAILARTNEILKPRVKANLLMSLLLIRWDEKEKRLFMTGAGHEYLMIYKYKQQKTFRIKSGGVALGMIKDISKLLKEKELSFEENDIIVLYSDGVTEAIDKPKRDGSEKLFGEDRLEVAINSSPNLPGKDYKTARSVFNNITINLSKFMGYKPLQLDDVTLAVIQYKPGGFNEKNDFEEEISSDFITEWTW